MSDFLTHLAARAIAQPTLRPRTRSRFEPPRAGTPAAVWPERSEPAAHDTGDNAAPLVVEKRAEAPSIETPQPDVERHEIVRTRPETIVRTRVEHDVKRVVETKGRTRDRIVRARSGEHPPQPPTVTAPPPHRFDEEPPRVIERDKDPEPEPTEGVPHPSRSAAILPSRPAPAANRRSGDVRGNAPIPQPVIEVTIGRVEVRAVTQPSAARKTSPGNRVMTIDDYVAKRNARDRR